MWVTVIQALLPILTSVASETSSSTMLNQIVTFLAGLIPLLVNEAAVLLAPVENIIANIEGNGVVSSADMAAVEALRDQIDAAIDAQAKADGLSTGDDDATGS